MRSQLRDMDPVDDFVTQQTPGLEIFQKVWGDMQCAYHKFAPGTDFTALLAPMPRHLCEVPHWAYVLSGSMEVIYEDSSEICSAGDVCFWPAPHNFKCENGAEIIQFSTSGGLAKQAEAIEEIMAKMAQEQQ